MLKLEKASDFIERKNWIEALSKVIQQVQKKNYKGQTEPNAARLTAKLVWMINNYTIDDAYKIYQQYLAENTIILGHVEKKFIYNALKKSKVYQEIENIIGKADSEPMLQPINFNEERLALAGFIKATSTLDEFTAKLFLGYAVTMAKLQKTLFNIKEICYSGGKGHGVSIFLKDLLEGTNIETENEYHGHISEPQFTRWLNVQPWYQSQILKGLLEEDFYNCNNYAYFHKDRDTAIKLIKSAYIFTQGLKKPLSVTTLDEYLTQSDQNLLKSYYICKGDDYYPPTINHYLKPLAVEVIQQIALLVTKTLKKWQQLESKQPEDLIALLKQFKYDLNWLLGLNDTNPLIHSSVLAFTKYTLGCKPSHLITEVENKICDQMLVSIINMHIAKNFLKYNKLCNETESISDILEQVQADITASLGKIEIPHFKDFLLKKLKRFFNAAQMEQYDTVQDLSYEQSSPDFPVDILSDIENWPALIAKTNIEEVYDEAYSSQYQPINDNGASTQAAPKK